MNQANEFPVEALWAEVHNSTGSERAEALSALSARLWEADRCEEAIEVGYALLAEQDFESGYIDESSAWHVFNLAHKLTETGRFTDSKELIDSVLELPQLSVSARSRGFLCWLQDANLTKLGSVEQRLAVLEEAAVCFADEEDELKGKVRRLLGKVYFESEAHQDAVREFATAVDLFEAAGEPALVAVTKIEFAHSLFEMGHLSMARKYATDVQQILIFLADFEGAQSAECLLGRISSLIGDVNTADVHFSKAMGAKATKSQLVNSAISSYYNAEHVERHGQPAAARELFLQIAPVLRSLGERGLADSAEGR